MPHFPNVLHVCTDYVYKVQYHCRISSAYACIYTIVCSLDDTFIVICVGAHTLEYKYTLVA